jgi:hypothetical protein
VSEAIPNVEGLLHQVFSPVEPPEDLAMRLESALTSLTEIAVEELDSWELSAMRDPRNWVRPAAALVVGGSAGVGLVLLRARHRAQAEASGPHVVRGAAERAVSDLRTQAQRLFSGR